MPYSFVALNLMFFAFMPVRSLDTSVILFVELRFSSQRILLQTVSCKISCRAVTIVYLLRLGSRLYSHAIDCRLQTEYKQRKKKTLVCSNAPAFGTGLYNTLRIIT